MLDSALDKILNNTFTKQDLYSRLGVVKECLENILFTAEDDGTSRVFLCAQFAKETGRPEMASFIEEWGTEVLDVFTADELYNQIEELKQKAEALPTVVLYVPVLLENKEVERVGRWCRGELDSRVMIDLMIDPRAIGGCAFVWQGKYHDFSLNYFLNKHSGEIRDLIKSYDAK